MYQGLLLFLAASNEKFTVLSVLKVGNFLTRRHTNSVKYFILVYGVTQADISSRFYHCVGMHSVSELTSGDFDLNIFGASSMQIWRRKTLQILLASRPWTDIVRKGFQNLWAGDEMLEVNVV